MKWTTYFIQSGLTHMGWVRQCRSKSAENKNLLKSAENENLLKSAENENWVPRWV